MCTLLNKSHQLATVHLNWSGLRIKHEPGASITAVATANGSEVVLAQVATERMAKISL